MDHLESSSFPSVDCDLESFNSASSSVIASSAVALEILNYEREIASKINNLNNNILNLHIQVKNIEKPKDKISLGFKMENAMRIFFVIILILLIIFVPVILIFVNSSSKLDDLNFQ